MSRVISDTEFEYPSIKDYFDLLKPRVMSLVIFTSLVGMFLAPGKINSFIGFLSIIFTSIGAGAAGCLNMWYDRDIDAIMTRTQKRPLARGAIQESDALAFGVILSIFSVLGMLIFVNVISSLILLLSIAFYFFVYTIWLKRSTIQNIVIGGAAGAFPPMIGWASVTNSIELGSIILFLIIFMWTPPHFWALALYKSDDYRRAKIPMMPIVKGVEYTKKQILLYTILMSATISFPYILKMSGMFYLLFSSLLSGYFLFLTLLLYFEKGISNAPRIFGYSILYLFLIFVILIFDRFIFF